MFDYTPFRLVSRIAAVVLFIIAALLFFGAATANTGDALGLVAVGLACLAASFLIP